MHSDYVRHTKRHMTVESRFTWDCVLSPIHGRQTLQSMSFPTSLSPSPVHEAFAGIQWDPLEKLALSEPEKALLRAAEDNPLDYTLADQHDAEAYAFCLLKVIDQSIVSAGTPRRSDSLRVATLGLERSLPDDEALQLLYVDSMGVVLHYAITKLTQVVICLKNCSRTAKITLATTFYPSGILVDHWRPLWRMLSGSLSDPFAQRGAAFCLACILLTGCSQEITVIWASLNPILESFMSWMTSRLSSARTSESLAIVTPSLTVLMVNQQAREAYDAVDGMAYLSRHLRIPPQMESSSTSHGSSIPASPSSPSRRTGASVQQLYELTYCMWLLSYDCQDSRRLRKHFHRDGAVPNLCELIVAAPREKVVRLALSTLRNLAFCTSPDRNYSTNTKETTNDVVEFGQDLFRREMVACGLSKAVDRMVLRQWSDPDIGQDLDLLGQVLRDTFQHMSRWDVYKSEVESSYLQWGIVHTEEFFRENVMSMEGKDGKFSIVRVSDNSPC
jgi:V-type H+-transporting ATPase subunit H